MFLLLLIIILAFWTKPYWEDTVREIIPESVSDTFHSATDLATQNIDYEINFDFDRVKDQVSMLYSSVIDSIQNSEQEPEPEPVEKPELTTPDEQSFSVGNVELGDTKAVVEEMYGEPMRENENEYGVKWSTYHENYQNFMMVAYDEQDVVRGLFTNQDLISSQHDLELGVPKSAVNETLGEPEEVIRNGWFNYQINSKGEYDIYHMDGSYVTIFYDIHEDDEMTAIQLIDENLESSKRALYTPSSEPLKEGFEYQLFDLTNATRVNHGLSVLEWNEDVRGTARDHSTDMAENQYFSHTNLEGESPFDRMREDEISFISAGENLAYGQFSSIFAHQGLMNSQGHRENIVNNRFTELGIGVDFNEDNQPFYTENFLDK
ncbi:CAP domain-containing protein [Oceanobacillus kimchii]|uniref:CAP domain-containing protein n=1 Tax=Oceanobacillus kimchii TaxID=746691 RepID=UPI00084E549D|nr:MULTISPECIES: CAP domain-containing protein [Oceanobacillus]MCT1577621.1 CAP domain-containing protein [Oceanobacillus kimchii]MCT2136609.1 CAP domain-containing protein [Oceanobacillus kimchii]OEH53750.1 serine protease [Oceanobacillus sp. E9]